MNEAGLIVYHTHHAPAIRVTFALHTSADVADSHAIPRGSKLEQTDKRSLWGYARSPGPTGSTTGAATYQRTTRVSSKRLSIGYPNHTGNPRYFLGLTARRKSLVLPRLFFLVENTASYY